MTKKTSLTWNLDDILKVEDFDNLYKDLKGRMKGFGEHLDAMQPDMTTEDFRAYIDFSQLFSKDMARLGSLPHLMEAVDTKSAVARKLSSRVRDFGIEVATKSRKISQWLKGREVVGKAQLDDKNAARLFSTLGDLEYVYTFMRENARYTLSEKEENIITVKDSNGVDALLDLRELIETEQRYEVDLEDGKGMRVIETQAELMGHTRSIDPRVRENTYRALFAAFEKNIDKYQLIYQSIVKDWGEDARLRGYATPIAMRNHANHVPDGAIETLMSVCSGNLGVFHDFFKVKASLMGIEKLRRFDLYAPLGEAESQYDYAEAQQLVDDVFAGFSESFVSKAREVVEAQHIDVLAGPTKRGGAFATTVNPGITPYVFLNYTGKARDVSTLAHELGHAVHFLYAKDKPYGAQFASLPLSETASTFGEMLLFEHLLSKSSNDNERIVMLADKLADAYATIIRQNYFVKFEIEAHAKMKDGLGVEELSDMWLDTLREQFGDAVEIDPIFAKEWSYIPHIVHTPFYCYAYSFGDLLSLALFARYKKEGASFVPKIEAILAAGGSRDPQEVLMEVGVDMTDASFWQGSFEILKGWQDQLEKLAKSQASSVDLPGSRVQTRAK